MNEMKKQNESKGSPEQSGGPLGSTLTQLLKSLTEVFSTIEPTDLNPEEFANEMLIFLSNLRPFAAEEGEVSYFAKRSALFLVDNLSLAAHRNRGFGQLSPEHAAILDEVTRKIQAVRTSLSGEPTVESLAQPEQDIKAFLKQSEKDSGLAKKILLPPR